MASAKDLRKRIGSVKNTQQITKAMKMVSAAKLRRAQENILALRPYAHEINNVISSLVSAQDPTAEANPLLASRDDGESNSLLLIVVSSDRGLCGSFNGSIIKATQRYMRTHAHKYKKFDLAFVGKKGYEFFKNKKPGKYYPNFYQGMKFAKAAEFSKELIQMYLSGEYDEIKFVYNEFKSAISQKVNVENYLPVRASEEFQGETQGMTIYEPNKAEILEALLPKHFATQAYRIFLESLASEHGARMSAMENATKNAGEMMRKLTLLYNKTRQAGITKELLEIVSGTEAQKA